MDKFRCNTKVVRSVTRQTGVHYAQFLAKLLFKEEQEISVRRERGNYLCIPLSGKVEVDGNDKIFAKVNIWFGVETKDRPKIWVKEPWVSPVFSDQNQVLPDWHRFGVDKDLGVQICWIFPEEWTDVLRDGRINRVAHQVAQNLKYWLCCHRIAYEQHLLDWPPDWPFVPHNTKKKEG